MKILALRGLFVLIFVCFADSLYPSHPCLFVSENDRPTIIQKIVKEDWARDIWSNMLNEITPYVDQHQLDPQWIVSRLAMYWKPGKHYTQCYLKKETWNYGTGNAPVPTVRLPGMRVWNDYYNVPLKDRIPYNETGDMKALSRSNPSAPIVIVPYKKSGHLIRQNNVEILSLAEKSAFIYWITGEEKFAKFAADIFNTWLLGVYYMHPPLDPDKDSGGEGGYASGGIMGYYDYEVIHDDTQLYAAGIYDFLFQYLTRHPNNHIKEIHKTTQQIAGEVFKRFVDIGLMRGGKHGNWNVNGFEMIFRSMLVLESNSFYNDGKGRDYYLSYYTTQSTPYHSALPEILESYDKITGLWPESPGYATGTIGSVLNIGLALYKNGINTLSSHPIILKAAMANLNWLDARGNLVVFGDMRGGPLQYSVYERLLSYYVNENDTLNAKKISEILQKGITTGQYDRSHGNWTTLATNVPLIKSQSSTLPFYETFYSDVHRHLIMKNGNDEQNGMMFTLYGGAKGSHLSENGLSLQLYYKGWAISPHAAAYESYWSADRDYYQTATGSNTILPGYTDGSIKINAIDPSIVEGSCHNDNVIYKNISFADVSASEKRRLIAMIRTSSTTGYYVDIFRSNLKDNDYLFHNLGNKISLTDLQGDSLQLENSQNLGKAYNSSYSYFINQRKISISDGFRAKWTIAKISPFLNMEMWMPGQEKREVYVVDAPPTTLLDVVTPGCVNKSPQYTPTVIVRQKDCNAKNHPFVALFEPFENNMGRIKSVSIVHQDSVSLCLSVENLPIDNLEKSQDLICNSIDNQMHTCLDNNIKFQGTFAVISTNGDKIQSLYLGNGLLIRKGEFNIKANRPVSASLVNRNGDWYYSSTDSISVCVVINGKQKNIDLPAGYDLPVYAEKK